jgi:hypothetical protein
MAFGATLAGIVIARFDLLEPTRTRWAPFVAAQAMAKGQLGQLNVRILHVPLACAMTSLTSQRFVLGFGQLLNVVRVAFIARLSSGKRRRAAGELPQGIGSVPPELAEGRWGEESAGREVSPDNEYSQQNQPEDLGRHFERSHTFG